MPVSLEQIKAARALLSWSQKDLAQKAGINVNTVAAIETGKNVPHQDTYQKIVNAIEIAGIEFLENDGLRRKVTGVITFKGREGFALFRRDVLQVARGDNPDICISNLDERLFDKWGEGDVNTHYRNEMAEIRKVRPELKFRSLARKGDTHFSAARHSEYRWVPESEFGEFPFYVYGHKTAMILFEEDNIEIFVINHPTVTEFFRAKFEKEWARAEIPDVPITVKRN